jgi:uncharacterized membrane protein YczE
MDIDIWFVLEEMMRKMIKRIIFLFWGLFLFALGIVLTVKSNLGTAPWDVLHLGLTNYLPVTMGEVSQMTGILVILLSWILGVKPGWGSVANMYFIGFFIDIIMASGWIPGPQQWLFQLVMLLAGVWIIGWASYFYLTAAFGAGPRDSFMVGAIQKTGWPVWKVRTILESAVAAIGYSLGGPIGIGTIIVALTLGPSIQWAFSIMGKRAQDIEHDPLVFWRRRTVVSDNQR